MGVATPPGGLEVRQLTKSYGGVPVLRGVDLVVRPGEIHALLGANGAGKSTLIKCVSGAEQPDGGDILLHGRVTTALTPRAAQRAGIAVIHQIPTLALSLDVADNIHLGAEPRRGPFTRRRRAGDLAAAALRALGSELDPRADLTGLGNADLQVIEIAKALVREPGVLILDEPTAALTEREVEQLAARLRELRRRGLPQLFVTHRLTEALELADRVTVLRGGRVVLNADTAEVGRADLVAAIVGRTAVALSGPARPVSTAAPLLTVDALTGPGIGPVDLRVRPGEIVGLFGLVGAGRTELLETLAGARRTASGRVTLDDEPLPSGPARAVAKGVALVPSDRLRTSVYPQLSAADNVLLGSYGRLARRAVLRDRSGEAELFDAVAQALHLTPHAPDQPAARYSGGNQQKLVIGRWLNSAVPCRLLLLDEPTDGVDVGARAELYAAIRAFVADGRRAVLMASSEPEELLAVADRVVVLSRGKVAGDLDRGELSDHRLLHLAHSGETTPVPPPVETSGAPRCAP